MKAIEQLERMLRPASGGIYTVSTGTEDQLRVQRRIYGAETNEDIIPLWKAALARLKKAKVVVLGVPSDVGAGFVRGTNFGPQSIRRELLRRDSWLYASEDVVDIGDVLCVPQLLHDEMLTDDQLSASRAAIYGDDADEMEWPVSPLSIAEAAVRLVRQIAPNAAPLVMGGDHSVGWPILAAVAAKREKKTGILHFDAHTDLLEHRLGVKYCFATWAHHANELIGRGQRMQQVGLRISGKTREYWEDKCDLRQYWMDEIHARPIDEIAAEIIGAFKNAKVKGVYISNDIDGTDPLYALATGTPEPGGLRPEQVTHLIGAVAAAYPIWGADVVEVAPPVAGHSPKEPAQTLATASLYMEAQAEAILSR